MQNGNGASPFENVHVIDNQVIGTRHSEGTSHRISGAGILIRDNAMATVTGNYVQRAGSCIRVDNGAGGSSISNNKCSSTGSGSTYSIDIADSNDNRVVGNTLYDQFGDALGLTTNAYRIVESGTANFNLFANNHGATYQTVGAATTINANSARPYKVYTALLTQSGTNAPVATVLENTLGGTVVWSRSSAGLYTATLAGAFTVGKVAVFTQAKESGTPDVFHRIDVSANVVANSVDLLTRYVDSSPSVLTNDGLLSGTVIEIRVYY